MCDVNGSVDRLLSVSSVCAALDVSDRGLRRWIAGGKFPAADVRIGGRTLRWRSSSIRRFIDEQSAKAAAVA